MTPTATLNPPAKSAPGPAHCEKKPPRVLIVDDDESPRIAHQWGLKNEFEVDTAGSVKEALALTVQNVYSVILLDIRMPGQDGLVGLKLIRAKDPAVGVIMMTSYTDIGPAQQAIDLGANAYMTKPAPMAALKARVQLEADRCRERRERENYLVSLQTIVSSLNRMQDDRLSSDLPVGEAASQFIHDLSQPLLGTVGNASLLAELIETLEPCSLAERLPELQTRGRYLDECARICVEMVNAWRAITKNRPLPVPFNLVALLTGLHNSVFIGTQRIKITAFGDCTVRGVALDYLRIFQNLLSNALEAGATAITAEVRSEGDFVRVMVADNGPGMPPDLVRSVFRRKVASNKPNGSGLGLSIVYHLVTMQRGEITLTSDSSGTTLFLKFPTAIA